MDDVERAFREAHGQAVATLALFRMVNAWTDLLAIPVDGV